MSDLPVGTTGEASHLVTPQDTAAVLSGGGDEFPAVLATTRMIGLMEVAAGRAMRPLVGPGEMSVGVEVNVVHSAPTPVHATVRAVATYRGREGKLYLFEVVAYDDGGEIGRGTHKRAIVNANRLVEGAQRRRGRPRS
ncbi:MAG TPA: thioesterase [Vicinamibacteria bacterium]|nr:thioesterase [Vicinamibacteria bacterium]